MLPSQRSLGTVLVLVLVVSAGCSAILGDGPLEYAASDVGIAESTVTEAGYESTVDRRHVLNRTIDISNESRQVTITSHIAAYEKSSGNSTLGAVVAVSTPQATELGQDLNPLGYLDRDALVERALGLADDRTEVTGGSVEAVGTTRMTALDTTVNVTTFETTVTRDGESIDAIVHATRFEHGSDFVVVVGTYPTDSESSIEEFETLLGGVEHDVETDTE